MDDNVMYAWQVVGDNSDYVHFTCARKETAEYLCDVMQAHEENMWRDISVECDVPYNLLYSSEQLFSIQECEVIL